MQSLKNQSQSQPSAEAIIEDLYQRLATSESRLSVIEQLVVSRDTQILNIFIRLFSIIDAGNDQHATDVTQLQELLRQKNAETDHLKRLLLQSTTTTKNHEAPKDDKKEKKTVKAE